MNSAVSYENIDNIAVICVDNPPVNALSHAVRHGLLEQLTKAEADPKADAIVIHCAGRTFIAGADITEFGKPPQDPSLPALLARIDASPKLTVAALHGTALGGGFETALACNYRIATETAAVGLPESKLGLLPGAGGTQRLPRIVGAQTALDMMINGNPVAAPAAKKSGVIDKLATGESLRDDAVDFAKDLLAENAAQRRASEASVEPVASGFFDEYRRAIARRTRGLEAPERIIRCVEAAVSLDFEAGLAVERERFLECMASTQSGAMRHMFFAERAVNKVPGLSKKTTVRSIDSVGVIGAGTMGAGIALACVNAGIATTMLDNDAEGLQRGLKTIDSILDSQLKKGRISADQKQTCQALLSTATNYSALANCDLVIEAVFESMAVKESVFGQLDAVCKDGAILASNTSTLDIDQIAASTKRPDDVIGLHFFSPANIMRLLEIVRGENTADEVIASSLAFAKRIGKLGVVVGNCFGFVGNRMLYGYGRENQFLLLEGAPPEQIDKALYDWGMAMGPNAVGDLAGLDVGYKVRQERTDLPDDPRYYRVATMLAELGRYGQKTGKGTYLYKQGDRSPHPDPDVQAMIDAESERLGITRRKIGNNEIVERTIYALVVEGCKILDQGIASRASDIDAIWVNGYGFPRQRGGPMYFADTVGVKNVYERVCEFCEQYGAEYWKPPALLKELAESGLGFADYDKR